MAYEHFKKKEGRYYVFGGPYVNKRAIIRRGRLVIKGGNLINDVDRRKVFFSGDNDPVYSSSDKQGIYTIMKLDPYYKYDKTSESRYLSDFIFQIQNAKITLKDILLLVDKKYPQKKRIDYVKIHRMFVRNKTIYILSNNYNMLMYKNDKLSLITLPFNLVNVKFIIPGQKSFFVYSRKGFLFKYFYDSKLFFRIGRFPSEIDYYDMKFQSEKFFYYGEGVTSDSDLFGTIYKTVKSYNLMTNAVKEYRLFFKGLSNNSKPIDMTFIVGKKYYECVLIFKKKIEIYKAKRGDV